MAVKFSQFNESASTAAVDFLVGYDGTDNVKISPSNLLGDYLPLSGGTMTGDLRIIKNTPTLGLHSSGSTARIEMGSGGGGGYSSETEISHSTLNRSLSISTDYATAMVIDNNQRVGLGTSVPAYKLDIRGGARIFQSAGGAPDRGVILRTRTGAGEVGSVASSDLYLNSSGDIEFQKDSALKMILKDGNLGVGTPSPNYKVNVVDTLEDFDVSIFIANKQPYGVGNGVKGGAIHLGKEDSVTATNDIMASMVGQPEDETSDQNGQLLLKTRKNGVVSTAAFISSDKDIEMQNIGKGVILKSPNGTRYRVTVDNGGNLVTTVVT